MRLQAASWGRDSVPRRQTLQQLAAHTDHRGHEGMKCVNMFVLQPSCGWFVAVFGLKCLLLFALAVSFVALCSHTHMYMLQIDMLHICMYVYAYISTWWSSCTPFETRIHTYTHRNVHTYIHASKCTYIHTHIKSCIHTYTHQNVHTSHIKTRIHT